MKIQKALAQGNKNRLGRGLDALLGPSQPARPSLWLDIEKIRPDKSQPRAAFDKESLIALSLSIKEHGVLQPILVKKEEKGYRIIAGERRWRAAGLAGLRTIPALVKNPPPHQRDLWALVENLQREDLNPMEEARAFKRILREKALSQEELAQSLGRSRPSVANSLRLLSLDKEVQKLVEAKKISFAKARELSRLKSLKKQREMAKACLKKSWTVRDLSQRAGGQKNSARPLWAKRALDQLEKRFSQKIKLECSKGRGRLAFPFKSEEDLKSLLNRLLGKF